MPQAVILETEERAWGEALQEVYHNETRTGVHVSDLITCIRRGLLLEEYKPDFGTGSLYRFSLGRSMEVAFMKILLDTKGVIYQELEVKEEGIEGHIDFASDPYDYECKFTFVRPRDTPDELFERQWYWAEQAGTYAIMRRRRSCIVTVVHVIMPEPIVIPYLVTWTAEEQGELWKAMRMRRDYRNRMQKLGEFGARTSHTQFCEGCPVHHACYHLEREYLE